MYSSDIIGMLAEQAFKSKLYVLEHNRSYNSFHILILAAVH